MQFYANKEKKKKKKSHFPHHQLETLKGSLGNNLHHSPLVLISINIELIFVPGPQEAPWQPTNGDPIKQIGKGNCNKRKQVNHFDLI